MYVGQSSRVTVRVKDAESGALVDPATFTFLFRAVDASGYATKTYTWDGSSWIGADDYGAPSRVSVGVFAIVVTIPYENTARGRWVVGWRTTSNADGEGGGSGEVELLAQPLQAI